MLQPSSYPNSFIIIEVLFAIQKSSKSKLNHSWKVERYLETLNWSCDMLAQGYEDLGNILMKLIGIKYININSKHNIIYRLYATIETMEWIFFHLNLYHYCTFSNHPSTHWFCFWPRDGTLVPPHCVFCARVSGSRSLLCPLLSSLTLSIIHLEN